MLITVRRIKSDNDATLSTIFVDGRFICCGLEDEYRTEKVFSETRIPSWIYHVKLRTYGRLHDRYSKKFPEMHEGMLEIADVEGFSDILIHIGNTDDDTAGCLLVGLSPDFDRMYLGKSRIAYVILYGLVIEAAKAGNLSIEFINDDLD